MRKEVLIEIIISIVVLIIIAGIYISACNGNNNAAHIYVIVGTEYIAKEIKNQEPTCERQSLPNSYEIFILDKNFRGRLGDVYYSMEYGTDICEYICGDGTKILLRYINGGNLDFLSIEFGIPYNVFIDNSENNIKQRMEGYFGENLEGYMFEIKEQNDYTYYSYKKYVNGIEAAEGLEIAMDNKGMVCKIRYLSPYAIAYKDIDLKHIEEADKCIKDEIESKYGEGIEYEIIKKQWAFRSRDTINYYISILGGDIVGYQVQLRDKIEQQGEGDKCGYCIIWGE